MSMMLLLLLLLMPPLLRSVNWLRAVTTMVSGLLWCTWHCHTWWSISGRARQRNPLPCAVLETHTTSLGCFLKSDHMGVGSGIWRSTDIHVAAGVGVVGRLGADVWNVISVDTWSSQGAVLHLKRMQVKPTSGISTCATSVRILTTLGGGDICQHRQLGRMWEAIICALVLLMICPFRFLGRDFRLGD